MTFRSPKLLASSKGQACVRCGKTDSVVGAHYTGVRRLNLGGGYGIKVHDFLTADLCQECHYYMDTISREKEKRYGHSEEFLYYIALTWERRFLQGIITVARKGAGVDPDPVPVLLGAVAAQAIPTGVLSVGDRAREGSEAVGAAAGEAP